MPYPNREGQQKTMKEVEMMRLLERVVTIVSMLLASFEEPIAKSPMEDVLNRALKKEQ